MQISVEPQVLERCASRIEEQCDAYQKNYRRLYQCIDELQAGWQGKDHMAYVTQIKGFEQDFVQMSRMLTAYAIFLHNTARIYIELQEDRVAKARTLNN